MLNSLKKKCNKVYFNFIRQIKKQSQLHKAKSIIKV